MRETKNADPKKKIPLGLSNYKVIIEDNFYYVDKTEYIEILENLNTRYQVFLRPRRFGKTLFVDTAKRYYDIKEKEHFDKLFGSTYIGKHKTPLANSFYVLHLNLSGLDTRDSSLLEEAFGDYIKSEIKSFLDYYDIDLALDEDKPFVAYTQRFLNSLRQYNSNLKLFIMIDEYDHFANALLGSPDSFHTATNQDGFIRNFYEVLKKHTQHVLDRIFITGVTSLTLDSLTSGFNICENISDYASLNDACGFSLNEVIDLVNYMELPEPEQILRILKENYNGYLFSPQAQHKVFNSNMILYFMNSYINRGGIPNELADPNIRGDYLKLSSMFDLYDEESEKENILQSLMLNESVIGTLTTSFSLATHFSRDHFLSLLYYLGLLTSEKSLPNGKYQFTTPNNVIKEIYYDYYYSYLTKNSSISASQIRNALKALETEHDISSLAAIVEQILSDFTDTNNRYMIHFRENSLQAIFFLLLRKSDSYHATMEYQIAGSYIDIVYQPIQAGQSYAIELKYISQSKIDADPAVLDQFITAVDKQIIKDKTLLDDVMGISVIFAGKKCVYCRLD